MSDAPAQVALLIDFDSLAAADGGAGPDPAELSAALLRYAGGVGRVAIARGYADWTKRPVESPRAVAAARVVPVLCPAGAGGEDRAHVRLAIDAMEALYAGGEPDAFVFATGDARLLPLVQAVRADGSDVLVVAPAGAAIDDVRREADAVATIEEALAGAVGRPSAPRPTHDDDDEGAEAPLPPAPRSFRPEPRHGGFGGGDRGPARGGGGGDGGGWGRQDRFDRGPPRERERFPQRAPIDLEHYDWAAFVRLIDELEHRLPFVGVRYLVNKVLGPRNCGTDDPRQKRDLINRAVDDGILEMYEVGNLEDRRDPVTACRLDRKNPVVVGVLGAETTTPVVQEARDDEGGADGAERGGAQDDGD